MATDYDAMRKTWNAAGRPGYITFGGVDYQVLTPNGEEAPVFKPQSSEALYGQTSTNTIAPEHRQTRKPTPIVKQQSKRNTDTGM